MRLSLQGTQRGILLMACSSVCVCLGQLLWKLSSEYGIFALLLGFVLYGMGAILMVIAYRYGKLSVLQPILSLNYVLSLILAALVLHEAITLPKCLGIIAVIAGLILITREPKQEKISP